MLRQRFNPHVMQTLLGHLGDPLQNAVSKVTFCLERLEQLLAVEGDDCAVGSCHGTGSCAPTG